VEISGQKGGNFCQKGGNFYVECIIMEEYYCKEIKTMKNFGHDSLFDEKQ